MKVIGIYLLSLIIWSLSFAQLDLNTIDAEVNAWNESKITSIKSLTKKIGEFDTESERIRAICMWMVKNLHYDYFALNNNLISYERCQPDYVFFKKKGVCSGYANLFKELCEQSGISCEVVNGIGRNSPSHIRNPEGSNHAWNVVQINGEWQIIDVTWADKGTQIDEFYFNADPEKIIINHYPEEKKWQLKEEVKELDDFLKGPFVYANYFASSLQDFAPKLGLLYGDTLSFQFESAAETSYTLEVRSIETDSMVYNYPYFYQERVGEVDSLVVYLPEIGSYELTFFALEKQNYSYHALLTYHIEGKKD